MNNKNPIRNQKAAPVIKLTNISIMAIKIIIIAKGLWCKNPEAKVELWSVVAKNMIASLKA